MSPSNSTLNNNRIPQTPPVILPVADTPDRPLWSVMIPAYNCIVYLQETIESVLIQDPGADKMQIVVVDDCSTDGDVEALVKKVGRGRVQLFKQDQNSGSLRNFETCLNRSKGKWIHLLHGDDRVEPGFYAEIESLFLKYPEAGAAFTRNCFINRASHVISEKKKLIAKDGIVDDFLLRSATFQKLDPPAIVVKRTVYEQLGGFFAVHYGEDWEMWTRIAAHYPVAYSPKCLAAYRIVENNNISHWSIISGQNIQDMLKVINIIQQYLPADKRKAIKQQSLAHYSIYFMKAANGMLGSNRKAALSQAKKAWNMCRNVRTTYWIIRFYLMYLFKVKEVQQFIAKYSVSITSALD